MWLAIPQADGHTGGCLGRLISVRTFSDYVFSCLVVQRAYAAQLHRPAQMPSQSATSHVSL